MIHYYKKNKNLRRIIDCIEIDVARGVIQWFALIPHNLYWIKYIVWFYLGRISWGSCMAGWWGWTGADGCSGSYTVGLLGSRRGMKGGWLHRDEWGPDGVVMWSEHLGTRGSRLRVGARLDELCASTLNHRISEREPGEQQAIQLSVIAVSQHLRGRHQSLL